MKQEKRLRLAAEDYAGERMDKNDNTWLIRKYAFIHGADWRINNAWHKSDEKPIPDKWIAVLTKDNRMNIMYSYDTILEYFKVMGITDWAYVEDLIPNK